MPTNSAGTVYRPEESPATDVFDRYPDDQPPNTLGCDQK